MTVNEYLSKTYKEGGLSKCGEITRIYIDTRPKVICADGYSVSIQASFSHYCTPRLTFNPGYEECGYTEVELGFPNMVDEELLKYAEDPYDPLNSIYAYVPVELVEEILTKHGGIVN